MERPPLNQYFLTEAELLELVDQIDDHGQADWQLFLSYAEVVQLEPGQMLVRQFEEDRTVYVLTTGVLEVRAAAGRGEPERAITLVEPVAILGEQTFLDGGPRTATLVARTEATVYRLSAEAFDHLRNEEPEIACAFLYDIARSLSLRARSLQAETARGR